MPPLHLTFAPLLLVSAALAQSIPWFNDGNDHWESPCPTHLNSALERDFIAAGSWEWKCDLNTDVSVDQPYPYQFQIKSAGVPDHTTTLAYVPSTYSFKTPLLKPLPEKGDDVLLLNTYKVSTLGTGPIGFAVNGVPFYSALSADNVNR